MLFLLTIRRPLGSALFPYTTLFRSRPISREREHHVIVPSRGSDQGRSRRSALLRPRSEDTRLNSSHANISYAVFCLKKKNKACWRLPSGIGFRGLLCSG